MAREQRLVFGEDAGLYDRARPSYPLELVDDVLTLTGTPSRALDVGCGTGKATVLLAARDVSGVGLEPDPDMAAVAARNLDQYCGWTVVVTDFERFQLPEGVPPFDLITCAQAWHWLDPDLRFRRSSALLRPGGRLALWWNRPDQDDSALRRRIDRVYRDRFPGLAPHGILATGRPPAGPVPSDAGFGVPIERVYRWWCRYSTAEWIDLMRTQSNHRLLEAGAREAFLAAVAEVIDNSGGHYDYPYSTWLWSAAKL
jgi:SAM-dependent methyltransferase